MSGGNVSPRQKMINMMYLVLTALLALNVSAEILKAFHLVEVSMDKAGNNIEKKNADILKAIDSYVTNNPTDAKGTNAQSQAVKVDKTAKDALKYLDDLINLLVDGTGPRNSGRKEGKADGEIEDASNMEKHANLFIVQGKGKELREKINKWRVDMLSALPANLQTEVKSDLNTDVTKGSTQTWEQELFEHSPLAAVVTLLTKIENDVKNTEAQVLDELKKDLTKVNIVVDQFDAKVIPNKGTYIIAGGKYEADIFLAASSSRSTFDLSVNGSRVEVENGIGKYSVSASGQGEKKYKGVITQTQIDGTKKEYPFEGEYFVTQPLAVVSATKMNVIYRAIPNPISVSVPGFDASQVLVSSTVGSITSAGQNGMYNIMVQPADVNKTLKINVSVKTDGATKQMGEMEFRLKNIPKPIPQLGSIEASGETEPAKIKAGNAVFTILKDFAFEGIKYDVKSFKIIYQPVTGPAQFEFVNAGNIVPPRMRAFLQNVRKGDKVIVIDIKAQGPQGLVPIPTPVVAICR
ncbi:MAG: gliding motility protein GldM [Bacteroidia bacterium]|nr:gliding motility protein GldM [Bacteroidia bacterium]